MPVIYARLGESVNEKGRWVVGGWGRTVGFTNGGINGGVGILNIPLGCNPGVAVHKHDFDFT
jgi:hypothetical protein